MKRYVARTDNLTKSYRGGYALRGVSIALEAGKLYGLIGQNGAGKTTLMRLLSGLAFPTEGEIELFGHRGERALQTERKRMGCMIEHPGYVHYLSAKDNMRYHRMLRGVPNKEAEDELLELVGLADAGRKKAKNFSLGMKQRLGIAIALLGNPELLILDEPVNGLDPVGVVEVRQLLKKLCEERNMTILISSHNLPELYQTVTDYIIIHKGEVRQTLTLEQLDQNCKRHLLIRCGQPEKLVSVLERELMTTNFRVMPDRSVKLYDCVNETERVAKALFDNGIVVETISVQGDTLENYFISVIGGERHA